MVIVAPARTERENLLNDRPPETHPSAQQPGIGPRQRRLDLVLQDLGLWSIVGPGWATVSPEGATFASISDRQVNLLMLHLEGLLAPPGGHPAICSEGTLTRDLDAVDGPASPPNENDHHLTWKPAWR